MANVRNKSSNPVFWVLMAVVLGIILFPVYWILVTSLKTPLEVVLPIPTIFPRELTLKNYIGVLQSGFLKNMGNSLVVSISSTLLSLAISFCAAYALSRFPFSLVLPTLCFLFGYWW